VVESALAVNGRGNPTSRPAAATMIIAPIVRIRLSVAGIG